MSIEKDIQKIKEFGISVKDFGKNLAVASERFNNGIVALNKLKKVK